MWIWDDVTNAWVACGRVKDVSVGMETDKIVQQQYVKGIRQTTQRRTVQQTGKLAFTAMEDLNPHTHDLLYADGTNQVVDQTFTAQTRVVEFPMMWNDDMQFLPNEFGLLSYTSLPAPGITSVTPQTTGGSITAGTYYLWFVPVYGTLPADPAVLTDLDKTWIFGSPTDETAGTAGYQGRAVTVGGTTSGSIDVVLTAPTDGPVPTGYIALGSATDDISAAHFWKTSAALTFTITAAATTTDYAAPKFAVAEEITAYSGSAYTVAARSLTADLTYDPASGTVKRVTAGAFVNGAPLRFRYWYNEPPSVKTTFGQVSADQDYRYILFTCLEGDDADTSLWHEEGLEIELFRVNVAGAGGSMRFPEDGFHEGVPVDLTAEWDSAQNAIGKISAYSEKFAKYIAAY